MVIYIYILYHSDIVMSLCRAKMTVGLLGDSHSWYVEKCG